MQTHPLLDVARAQGGVISTRQAVALGYGESLPHLRRRGLLRRVVRGWHVVDWPDKLEAQHELVARAVLQAFDGRVLLSHHSALIRHGLPTYQANLYRVAVCRRSDQFSRCTGPVSVHCAVPDGCVSPADGDVVTPACAVVQAGLGGNAVASLVAADAALRRHLTTPEELAAALAVLAPRPGIAAVRRILEHVDPAAESPGESVLRWIVMTAGIPVRSQVWIEAEGVEYRVDLRLEGDDVILEFDGLEKYGGGVDVVAEKLREDALRRTGYEVERVILARAGRPGPRAAPGSGRRGSQPDPPPGRAGHEVAPPRPPAPGQRIRRGVSAGLSVLTPTPMC